MPIPLRQSTAKTVRVGRVVDKTDGVTAITGITSGTMHTNLKLSKDDGAGAGRNASGSITHDVNGWYLIPLDTTDTNTLGRLTVSVYDNTVHVPVDLEFWVYPAAVFDWLIGATGGVTLADGAITTAKIADGALTAAKFAANALDAVWSTTTRLLTAGANIVLAKGTGVTGFNDVSTAQVNAEVLDVLTVDTFAEPAAVPAATASLKDKIGYLMLKARNKRTQTATTARVYADDGSTVVASAAVSDDGTVFTVGEDA